MRKSRKIKSLFRIQMIFLQIFAVVSSLLLSPKILAAAQTETEENQNLNYHSYLPIAVGGKEAHFVSTTGNDNNPGTFLQPWRTIGKAADSIEPGDVVYIRGGIYQEAVDIKVSGTGRAPIKIKAYPGETPIIDGNNYDLPHEYGGSLLELSGNYIYVSGLEVRYSSYAGVTIIGAYDTADKINSHHNYHGGMRIGGDYSIIENSMVWSNDMQNENGIYPAGDSTGLTAARRPNYAVLRNNKVFGNWGIGMSTYESNGTILEDNIVFDNFGANVYISDATNVLFQRNFVYTTGAMIGGVQVGIQVADEVSDPRSSNISIINNIVFATDRNLACWKGSSGEMVNVLISNNTFVNSNEDSGVVFNDGLLFQNVQFINNIIRQDGSLPIILVDNNHPGLTFASNLWSKPPRTAASGPGDIIGNPLFAQTGTPFWPEWYMLTGVSPAIDRAISLSAVNVDYFGITREAPPDMGANEFFPTP